MQHDIFVFLMDQCANLVCEKGCEKTGHMYIMTLQMIPFIWTDNLQGIPLFSTDKLFAVLYLQHCNGRDAQCHQKKCINFGL